MIVKLFIKSRWTLIVLALVIAAILVYSDMATVAAEFFLLTLGVIIAFHSHIEENPLSQAFITGALAGLAGLLWIYALVAYIPFLVILVWPLRSRTFKTFMSSLFGLAAPWWIYLPYYLYSLLQTYK